MLEGIVATTIRMIPFVTLVAALGILIGMISLAVYGVFVSRRERREAGAAIALTSPDVK